MVITSLNNEHIKEINKLKEKKYRDQMGTFLIEGEHLVIEAAKKNILKELIILEEKEFDLENVKITYVNKDVMKKLSSMDSYPSVIGLCSKIKEEKIEGNVLILDDIQDPGNLGTMIRSSAAFNIDTIILSPKTVDLYNHKVIRSTQGMIFSVNVIVKELEEIIPVLKDNSYKIYGTKVDGGTNVKNINSKDKYALVIGNEGKGMSEKVSNLCDEYLYIKMNEKVESLNAAVAASILLYELGNK